MDTDMDTPKSLPLLPHSTHLVCTIHLYSRLHLAILVT